MVKHMAREFSVTYVVDYMTEIGSMIRNKVKALNGGTTVLLDTKATSKKVERPERANFNSKEAPIRAISLMASSMDKESTILPNQERYIMVILQIIN